MRCATLSSTWCWILKNSQFVLTVPQCHMHIYSLGFSHSVHLSNEYELYTRPTLSAPLTQSAVYICSPINVLRKTFCTYLFKVHFEYGQMFAETISFHLPSTRLAKKTATERRSPHSMAGSGNTPDDHFSLDVSSLTIRHRRFNDLHCLIWLHRNMCVSGSVDTSSAEYHKISRLNK